MGDSHQPPYVGEIPNTLFGVMPIGGVINEPGTLREMGGGPVRAFGVIWQPFGDVSTGPPCKGIIEETPFWGVIIHPPAIGNTGMPGFFGYIDQT